MTVPLFDDLAGATHSSCGSYRYRIWRVWDTASPYLLFILLNPSTAAADASDPTLDRCVVRARQLGYGGVHIVNLFAWRSTDKSVLPSVEDAVGPDNDTAIRDALHGAGMVICGWGADGVLKKRDREVKQILRETGVTCYALVINKDGTPKHPLYVAYGLSPVVFDTAEK